MYWEIDLLFELSLLGRSGYAPEFFRRRISLFSYAPESYLQVALDRWR